MLIFNADDYGVTELDVERILVSLDWGVIRSTTIAPNLVEERHLDALKTKSGSYGIHINLVEGPALSTAGSLVDGAGRLLDKKALVLRLLARRVDQKDIEREIAMQFERLLDCHVPISHIDSHQNMHFLPQIVRAIVKVADRFSVRKIRPLDAEYFWFNNSYSNTKILAKKAVIRAFIGRSLGNMMSPDAVVLNAPGLGFSVTSLDEALALWDRALGRNYDPAKVYEVPCHMDLSDSEFQLYNSAEFKSLLQRHEVRIGDFNGI